MRPITASETRKKKMEKKVLAVNKVWEVEEAYFKLRQEKTRTGTMKRRYKRSGAPMSISRRILIARIFRVEKECAAFSFLRNWWRM